MKVKAKYNEEQIRSVGIEIASLWGGECLSYEVVKENGETIYRFMCIEHGDEFFTDVKESEIETDYAYCL